MRHRRATTRIERPTWAPPAPAVLPADPTLPSCTAGTGRGPGTRGRACRGARPRAGAARARTHVESAQEEQRGLQPHGEDEPQNRGRDQRPDAVGFGERDDDGQRDEHGRPQQPRPVRLQRPCKTGGSRSRACGERRDRQRGLNQTFSRHLRPGPSARLQFPTWDRTLPPIFPPHLHSCSFPWETRPCPGPLRP